MSLPTDYVRLKSIQSDGTQYISTQLTPTPNTRVVLDVQLLSSQSLPCSLFGSRETTKLSVVELPVGYFWVTVDANGYFSTGYGTEDPETFSTSVDSNSRISIDKNGNVTTVGTESVTQTASTATELSTLPMYLFAENYNGTAAKFTSMELFSCKIYESGTLVRDYIPCKNASGVVGLWDDVNSIFYENAGSGAFIAGAALAETVDENEVTELEWIQSSGTQYVDTNFFPNQDTRCVLDMESVASHSDTPLFGARVAYQNTAFSLWLRDTKIQTDYNAVSSVITLETTLKRFVIDKNKNVTTADGVTVTQTAATFQSAYSAYLFGLNQAGALNASGTVSIKLYSCQLYNNGLLERDYIPAMLITGEVGIYDKANSMFYRNAGTGEFAAGPEVTLAPNTPENFRVESETDTLVTLAWDAMEDVLGYRLYRQGQLVADTTETSISVTVEPFAGAVFTLTAYNENGESSGVSLTYYNVPENPLLYLITDRTQQDVLELNPKGYYAASDLNRVGYAMIYVVERIAKQGTQVSISPKTDWTDTDWMAQGEAATYLEDLSKIRSAVSVLSTTPKVPDDLTGFTFEEANNIELILLDIDRMLTFVYTNLLYAGEVFAGEV